MRQGGILAILILMVFVIPFNGHDFMVPASSSHAGPYLDTIRYNIYDSFEEQLLALDANQIDLIGQPFDPDELSDIIFLPSNPDKIELSHHLRNGYGYFVINCDWYPFNITAFRRAMAIALDKEDIAWNMLEGLAEPLDSVIPKINPFSVEGQAPYNYYEGNSTLANHTLDAAGFLDVTFDGYREAPAGNPFNVTIDFAMTSSIAQASSQMLADALETMGVRAVS